MKSSPADSRVVPETARHVMHAYAEVNTGSHRGQRPSDQKQESEARTFLIRPGDKQLCGDAGG